MLESLFDKGVIQDICYPVNIERFLTTAFLIEHHWWLLLDILRYHNLNSNNVFKCIHSGIKLNNK